jgi:hypothetical protein
LYHKIQDLYNSKILIELNDPIKLNLIEFEKRFEDHKLTEDVRYKLFPGVSEFWFYTIKKSDYITEEKMEKELTELTEKIEHLIEALEICGLEITGALRLYCKTGKCRDLFDAMQINAEITEIIGNKTILKEMV